MCQRVAAPDTDQTPLEYLMKELWQPIDGYEGLYEVSDQGQVRSLDRLKTFQGRWGTETKRIKGRVLRPGRQINGRLYVNLSKDNQPWVVTIHKLVALTFLGPRPEGMDIDHVNGDFLDNRACNLEYVTHQENQKRAYEMGKIKPPSDNARNPKTGRFMKAKVSPRPPVAA